MRSTMDEKMRTLVAVALAAAMIGASPSVLGQQVWSPVKQKILAGAPIVAKRVDSSDPATYCSIASTPGTDFTWTDMVSSGLEFSYVWAMWAAPCPTALAKMRGAEIYFDKRIDFINHAHFRLPDPRANELIVKEMQHATEGGAMVIMINVDNVDQARQVVKRAYYPPIGARDLGPGQYDTVNPASVTGGNYVGTYNDNVVVIAIISTVAGVSQAKTIAAVSGIHALFVDTANLESDSGYAQGTPDYNKLADFVRVSALASRKHLCTADRSTTPHTLTCAKPSVSFFVSSATSATGNLGGLAGADARCQQLGAAINQGARTWRAYLSVERDSNGAPVNARDRIGSGPWYNANLQLIANDLAALHSRTGDANLFVDERGQRINGQWIGSPTPVEHDILTGSKADGTLLPGATCSDWTSAATDVTAQVGHSDGLGPNQNSTPPLSSWNSAHTALNCSNTAPRGGAGRIYCFAQ